MPNEINQQVLILRILYAIWVVVGIFSLVYMPSQLIDYANPALTADNIVSNQLFFRAGILAAAFTALIHVLVVIMFYHLFAPFGIEDCRFNLVLFGMAGVPLALIGPVALLGALEAAPDTIGHYLSWQKNSQLIASIFWGMWLFPLGNLAVGSGLFPRFIRPALWAAAFGYLLAFIVKILVPNAKLLITLADIMIMGEMIFVIWLVVMGAKDPSPKTH